MAKLKVYSGLVMTQEGQMKTVVAATSFVKASAALKAAKLNISAPEITKYWSVTGNTKQIEAAMSKPGAVFQATEKHGDVYVELPAREVTP